MGTSPASPTSGRDGQLVAARAAVEQAKAWKEKIRLDQGGLVLMEAADVNLRQAQERLTALRNPVERLQAAQDRYRSHCESRDRLESELARLRTAVSDSEARLQAVTVQVREASAERDALQQAHDAWIAEQTAASEESPEGAPESAPPHPAALAAALRTLPGRLRASLEAASATQDSPMDGDSDGPGPGTVPRLSVDDLMHVLEGLLPAMFQDLAQDGSPRAPAQGVVLQPNGKRRATTTPAAEAGAYGHPSAPAANGHPGPTDPPGVSFPETPGPQFSVTDPLGLFSGS